MSAPAGALAWSRACLAAALVARDPAGSRGIAVRARPGPVREAWLARLQALLAPGRPVRRLPPGIADDRLIGGLDLVATLRAGRPVPQAGLLAEADGGLVIVPMAERLGAGTAARIAAALDAGAVAVERDGIAARAPARFGLVLLDEGEADEAPPAALLDRVAILLDLDAVGLADLADRARGAEAPGREAPAGEGSPAPPAREAAEAAEAVCAVAAALGVASMRAPLMALKVAQLHATHSGRAGVAEDDIAAAAALVLAPRATRLPAEAPEPSPPEPSPPEPDGPPDARAGDAPQDADPQDPGPQDADPQDPGPGEAGGAAERVLAAARAAIPADLLARLAADGGPRPRMPVAGRAGAAALQARRGRPAGTRPGDPRTGRIALVETLRAAAPWQRLRGRDEARPIRVEPGDIRIRRLVHRTETTTIFAVDASGSAALERLAEAKGAVELLLAQAYVRRDRVALVAFRGSGAELVLPPTRSLVRARRGLAGLPGGGGTPLAAGIAAAEALAAGVRRAGQTPVVVVLTDGRANVARSGAPGRARAAADALAAARALGAAGTRALLIDTAPQPRDEARHLADAMAATYLPLPYADAARLTEAVRRAGG
ncbi:Magnesium-chelatase 60 kDa subunit [Methylobacterium crusticola]|uniref:Magnesium-chelatase 60 kDa subunit n=2 Tax=Methylobacterium crusticola TaxID=1697972 RepID=A0ABQ4QSN8_9HYPH|nr:magnesium chelatase subunit D [Methylobacterium crusticola]GJD48071.1 Magnesium-chelatase 60 kDa subunit [Methylobacterium crusticola]